MANSRQDIYKPITAETDEMVSFGGEIKALGNGKVGGYLVRFTDATQPDLTGDYFSAKSDIRVTGSLDVYYNHGLDATLKKRVIGRATTRIDDAGVWAETQLNMRDEYEKAIYSMAEKGKLGYSSGALPHLVEREPAGKGISFIKTWVIGEASLTPTPAEPRNTVVSIKTLSTPSDQAALPIADDNPIIPEIKKDETTMNEEIKTAIDAALAERDAAQKIEADKQAALKAASDAGYKQAVEELKSKRLLKETPAYIKNLTSDSDDGVMAFKAWLGTGEVNHELIEPNDSNGWMKAAFNVTTGASGGYLVPDPLYQIIIAKRALMSWARQAPVQTFTTPADHILVPVEDTAATAFVLTAEAGAYNENEATVSQKDLILYKYTKLVKMSEEFANYQGTNFDAWIANSFARAEAVTENTIFTTGTGTSEPQGVLTGSTTGNVVTTSAVLVPQDLTTLIGQLGAGYNVAGQTGFLMKNATKWYLKGTSSTNYFAFIQTPNAGPNTFPGGLAGDGFLGQPAYISDDMHAYTVAANTGFSVLYGNYNYYGIAEKPGLLIQRNPYLYMANGQIGLFATMYRGGSVLQAEAFYHTVGK